MNQEQINKVSKGIATVLAIVFVMVLAVCVSWAICAGFVCLIMLCFGLEFSFATATGVWLCFLMLGAFVTMLRS